MDSSPMNIIIGTINEYICEIRFKPNSKILDHRGSLAESLSSVLDMPHWRIGENRIDIYDEEKIDDALERGFVSFRNLGYVFRNCASGEKFFDKFNTLLKYIYERGDVFDKQFFIERIGVRTRFGNEFIGTFEALRNLYLTQYLIPNNKINLLFDADITDFGGNLTFKAKSGGYEMNSMTGPMEAEQLKQHLPFVEKPPAVSLYFDIDTFTKPKNELNYFQVIAILESHIRNNWTINNKITRLLAGG